MSRIPQYAKILTETEVVDEFVKSTGLSATLCYCKECGKFLNHNEKFWVKQNSKNHITLGCTNIKHTFLHTKIYNGHEYRRCVCNDCIKKKFPNYKGMLTCQSAFYVQYAFGVSDEDFKEIKEKVCLRTEEFYIKRFGKDEGLKRWNAYRDKQSYSNTFEYKQEKYGWDKEQFNRYNKSRAVTLDNLIKRHGDIKGHIIWEKYIKQQRYTTTKEYFVKTYGEDYGLKKWEAFDKAHHMFRKSSDISQELFYQIKRLFPENDIYFDDYNGEYRVGPYSVDYIDHTLKIVIEFYGDYWHMNPVQYESNSYNKRRKMFAKDIWSRDNERIEDILSILGPNYKLYVVWERDYLNFKSDNVLDLLYNQKVYKFDNRSFLSC